MTTPSVRDKMWGGGEGRSEGEEVMRMKPAIYKIQIPTIPSTIRIARAERALRSCLVILNIFLEPVFVEAREYFSHEGFVSDITVSDNSPFSYAFCAFWRK